MRFVAVKSDDQLGLQSLHRVRERWVMRRTAVVNQSWTSARTQRGVPETGNRHERNSASER